MRRRPAALDELPLRRRTLGLMGVGLVTAALFANEWLLARMVSDDGVLEPLTVARVRLFQVTTAGVGLLTVAARRWGARRGPIRALMVERPRHFAMFVGVVVAIALWLLAEGVYGILNRQSAAAYSVQVIAADGTVGETVAMPDESLGYKLIPNLQAQIRIVDERGRITYDIDSDTDQFSRRITPVQTTSSRDHYALFFGCSFTWGDGVRGTETLPAALAGHAPRFQPYNYGFRGYGPQQMLERLRAPDIRKQVDEREGIAIYTAIDAHLQRTIGSLRVATSIRGGFPYYHFDTNGRLIREGSFVTARPWRQLLYEFLSRSQVLQYYKVDFPLHATDDHFALMAAIIAESRQVYQRTFGNDRFYVVLYPGSWSLKRLLPHLEERGVKYFDYTNLFDGETRPLIIEGDGHPTPLAYGLVAARLAEDLQIRMTTPSR